jgi:hypothetical protein
MNGCERLWAFVIVVSASGTGLGHCHLSLMVCWLLLAVVFKGLVHRTEKKTETGLNRTD